MMDAQQILEQFILWSHKGGKGTPECARPGYTYGNDEPNRIFITDETALSVDKRIAELARSWQHSTHDWQTPIEWKEVRLCNASPYQRAERLGMKITMYRARMRTFEQFIINNL